MTLTELRYLVALARERHFGHAAQVCNVSQPTLSAAIKKLEEQLGMPLFERRPREVVVTPQAEPIIAQAQRPIFITSTAKEACSCKSCGGGGRGGGRHSDQ